MTPEKASLYNDLGIISPLKYFDELNSLSPMKTDRDFLKSDFSNIGAFELMTFSPVKVSHKV